MNGAASPGAVCGERSAGCPFPGTLTSEPRSTLAAGADDDRLARLRAVGAADSLGERLVLRRQAGAGGMGRVFEAIDERDGRPVAVKLIRAVRGEGDLARFAVEAEILESLDHPAIVAYVGHGTTAQGDHYLAMAWLEGEDLSARLTRGPLTVRETLALGQRLAEGLAAAHGAGVIHRDLKPSNVVLVDGDVARATLVDFGIARRSGIDGLTRTGEMLGTPGYMAPEQVRGRRDLDGRADLFSLGCVLFHALAGRAPFGGDDVMTLLARLLLEEAPRIRSLRADAPLALDDLLGRLLAKDPSGRPARAVDVAARLAAIARALDEPPAARPTPRVGRPVSSTPAPRARWRWRSIVGLGGTALIVAAGLAGMRAPSPRVSAEQSIRAAAIGPPAAAPAEAPEVPRDPCAAEPEACRASSTATPELAIERPQPARAMASIPEERRESAALAEAMSLAGDPATATSPAQPVPARRPPPWLDAGLSPGLLGTGRLGRSLSLRYGGRSRRIGPPPDDPPRDPPRDPPPDLSNEPCSRAYRQIEAECLRAAGVIAGAGDRLTVNLRAGCTDTALDVKGHCCATTPDRSCEPGEGHPDPLPGGVPLDMGYEHCSARYRRVIDECLEAIGVTHGGAEGSEVARRYCWLLAIGENAECCQEHPTDESCLPSPERPQWPNACADQNEKRYRECLQELGADPDAPEPSNLDHASYCWNEVVEPPFAACCAATPDVSCAE